jgi:hypothetical protein
MQSADVDSKLHTLATLYAD